MSVDREEVERIGRLAKLRLTDDEAERLTDEMNRILEHAERLRGLEEASEAGSAADAVDTEGEDGDAEGAGDEGPDSPRTTDPKWPGRSGTRSPAAEIPDTLHIELSTYAPDVREGFFVVPPPPGVLAEEEGEGGA